MTSKRTSLAPIAASLLLLGTHSAFSQAKPAAPAAPTTPAHSPAPPSGPIVLTKESSAFLETYCISCHEQGTTKGDVQLDNFATLSLSAQIDLLNKVQEQVHLQDMPPKRKKQPTEAERAKFVAWTISELRPRKAAKFEEKLRFPAYGNSTDHVALFSGKITEAPFTPARRWLVSPQIFEDRVVAVAGSRPKGVSNPFLLTDASGVRYYDNGILDGSHLLLMLTNANVIADQEIYTARVKAGDPAVMPDPTAKDKKGNPLPPPDIKKLKASHPAFEAIILKKTAPTEDEMNAAVKAQFNLVLRRDPAADELKKHADLTKSAIELAGNIQGLKQMLQSILLESEFLYRLEFGAGEPDSFGRKMLAPREAAYAISYALGDHEPDAALFKAAQEGKLNNKEDYKREVMRLLNDKNYYKGFVDPQLVTRGTKPHETSHPRINRFFREFFGYPNAIKVFKDSERSGYYYQNPDRGTFGTAGTLVNEADILVDTILQKDQNVFETLLTTEEYFVAPVADAAKKVEQLEAIYEKFKNTDWKKNPDGVLADPSNKEFFQKLVYKGAGKHLTQIMTHVTKFKEKNLRPNPAWNYAFGTTLMLWVNSYNFAPFEWEYPLQQPLKVPNRKGILTHPAWLIAHSQNTQNDPVTRGRWVREKLLAGRTPDVPITVEAVIPEDPTKTLRGRLDMVTNKEECWKCHQFMNPLGVPFESYDDFGRFRIAEPLEHPSNITGKGGGGKYSWNIYKTLAVDPRGSLEGTGDPALDGPVKDAADLITRLAKSTRVRQSIIRHAFRFYMGRNEMLSDSKTLIDADNAYVKSGGSFKAVILSLLTSDSFMYRK